MGFLSSLTPYPPPFKGPEKYTGIQDSHFKTGGEPSRLGSMKLFARYALISLSDANRFATMG
jgi:hypothetical protein